MGREESKRLLIVEDEPVLLTVLQAVFADAPWEVVACGTGREALEAMDQGVDLLLTDKNLPDVGGLELIARARDHTPDAECLLLTGFPSFDTALEALHLEVFDYIVKPPRDVFDVRRKVEQASGRQDIRRENLALTERLQSQNQALQASLEEVRSLQSEVIQAEKLAGIGTLASGVAHEISSPLFGILGLAEAILDEDDLSLVHGYASEIVEYSHHIKTIVADLSGYARREAREGTERLELGPLVDDAARLVERALGAPELELRLEVPEGLWVEGRPGELRQVFVNLLKNAGQAVEGRGTVVVSGGLQHGQAWVRVRDDGPGIPAEQLEVIFDPFYTTKPPGRGTGLGLNIVYRILTGYGGGVSVESRPGEGAAFTVRLPQIRPLAQDAG